MGLLDPRLPDYDALAWRRMPLAERGRLVCEAWATQGYGTPLLIFVVYALKVLAYVGGWLWFCSFTPGLGGLDTLGSWWLEPIAFEKAILFSMLFEGLGLGCGSGPLTGRYLPPVGGALYWLRPGTTKLPVFQRLPLLGGHRRSLVDVLLYAAVIGLLVTALVQPVPTAELLWAIVMVVVALGLADRTIAYALRAEHRGVHHWRPWRWRTGVDRGRQSGAARTVVLRRGLEAQPPLPVGGVRDDEQRAAHTRTPSQADVQELP
jgi:hypothetical protein